MYIHIVLPCAHGNGISYLAHMEMAYPRTKMLHAARLWRVANIHKRNQSV